MNGDPTPDAIFHPHPLTAVVPRMSDSQFLRLRESVRARGFLPHSEIVLYEGQILDGRHLYAACLAEGVTPRFREYTGDDPLGYVLAMLTRQNLDEPRTALYAAGVLLRQADEGGSGRTPAQLALQFGVRRSLILEATRVLQHAVPKLRRMVENRQVTITQADRICRLPVREQQRVVDAGAYSVKAKGWSLKKDKARRPIPPDLPAAPENS